MGVAKRHAPSALRNREPILGVLSRVLPASGTVLEIASGSGEHVVFFAAALPRLRFQPTDADPAALASIDAHREESGLANVLPALTLDVEQGPWPRAEFAALVCINMIHIAPFSACEALFRGAAERMRVGAPLVLYGPFRFVGAFFAPSNEAFDVDLRARNPAWGIRDIVEVDRVAVDADFVRQEVIALPANNHAVVFRRV